MNRAPIRRRDFLRSTACSVVVCPTITSLLAQANPACAAERPGPQFEFYDSTGAFGRTEAPVSILLTLPDRLSHLAAQGRLALTEKSIRTNSGFLIPVQSQNEASGMTRLFWLMPPGGAGRREFVLHSISQPVTGMFAFRTAGQYEIHECHSPVLRYNYARVDPGDILKAISPDNRKYAVSRSDYIHPLFGPHGETLTKDWSVDHPHHRGIYWAWPEVDWQSNRGDLHALQKVFARPTGKCEMTSGPVFAQLIGENLWHWEDREPIVHERARIRVYAARMPWRLLDLEFRFEALRDPVWLARRDTSHYGGLNLRFSSVQGQQIVKHIDPVSSTPRMAWADISGRFAGARDAAGVMIIQRVSNPEYPGDWVDYPELNWLQPTFPTSGTRYQVKPGTPLVLRFRLVVHSGAKVSPPIAQDLWRAANS
jgi:hypothetical protein